MFYIRYLSLVCHRCYYLFYLRSSLYEVQEETGFIPQLVQPKQSTKVYYTYIHPRTSEPVDKTVDYYLMRVVGGTAENHDHEVIEVLHKTPEQAIRCLTYDNDRDVVRKFMAPGSRRNWHCRLFFSVAVASLASAVLV